MSWGEFVCDLGLIGLLLFLLCNFIEGKIHNGILTAWTQGSLNREKNTQIKSLEFLIETNNDNDYHTNPGPGGRWWCCQFYQSS